MWLCLDAYRLAIYSFEQAVEFRMLRCHDHDSAAGNIRLSNADVWTVCRSVDRRCAMQLSMYVV